MAHNFSACGVHAALGCVVSMAAISSPMQAYALELDDETGNPAENSADSSIAEQLKTMRNELRLQRELIEQQNVTIAQQREAIDNLLRRTTGEFDLTQLRASGVGHNTAPSTMAYATQLPDAPVGEAPPPEPAVEAMVVAVPEGQGVLTPAGRLTLDTSFEYTNSTANRLVFRGFELIPGLQVGLIEASDADRDALIGTVSLRYGITERLEIEGRMPVMYRHDRIKVTQLRDEGIVRTLKLEESDIGDAEIVLRYQVNAPTEQNRMIGIASLRIKSTTGKSPFDVGFDSFGVATGLPTGSGFWGVQPGLNFLLPSDPVVIYGGMSFLYHLPKDVDRIVGDVLVGRVDPGDAASANIGFGFALNPRFSFSLGYNHTYIFPTKQIIGGTEQRSTHLQSGTFAFGMSYRLDERQSINFGLQIGATADAPGLSVVLRLPITF